MTRTPPSVLAIYGLIVFVVAGFVAAFMYNRSQQIPDRHETVGPFEIVNHGKGSYFSLRYQGKPFAFDGKSGMFGDDTAHYETMNAVVTFPSGESAFVVNVGDPNNSSFFYLIREVNGSPVAQFAGESSGDVSVDFLDPVAKDSSVIRNVAVHRSRLHGGRWLLLGQFSVLDVEKMELYRFAYHPNASLNQFKPPITMSPDKRSFVRFGYGESPANVPVLIVFVFADSTSYTVPIERGVARFNQWEDIDLAWLDHYYEWQSDSTGHARLLPRANVTPLPYQGRLTVESDGYREYNVLPVKPEMKDSLVAFLIREYKAERQPPPQYDGGAVELRIGEQVVNVMITNDTHAGIWMDRGSDSKLVEEIGKRFDEELKGGTYDHLFLQ
ncbi:MAG: hypothetical protein ABI679_06410 [Gemmatimonadota bacterium]